jgi:hypothetical protein
MKKIIAVFVLAAPFALTSCSKSLENQIVGKWNYSTEAPLPDDKDAKNGKMKLTCDDEYFPNKSVTHECTFVVTAEAADASSQRVKFDITGTLKATGEWSVTKDSIYDKTVDGKIEIESFTVNGQPIADEQILAELKENMANPFMKGETSVSKSLSIDKDKWVFEEEIEKQRITVTATRR